MTHSFLFLVTTRTPHRDIHIRFQRSYHNHIETGRDSIIVFRGQIWPMRQKICISCDKLSRRFACVCRSSKTAGALDKGVKRGEEVGYSISATTCRETRRQKIYKSYVAKIRVYTTVRLDTTTFVICTKRSPNMSTNEKGLINGRMDKESDEAESSGLRVRLPSTTMLPRFGVALVPLQHSFNDRCAS